jgi:predicted permease
VRAVAGVVEAGWTTSIPFAGNYTDLVILADGYQMAPGESLVTPNQVRVGPGYFEAMRTELQAGRFFDSRDTATSLPVIIVDERLARKFWPGQDPIGRLMYFPSDIDSALVAPPRAEWMTVVGVVESVRLGGLVDGPTISAVGAYYRPLTQSVAWTLQLAVRTAPDPLSLTSAVRQSIASIDPELPFYAVRTMDERVSLALVDRRTPMILALGFAVVALSLAAIGIYGMLAYQVSLRRREIGIRLALGAETTSIFRMVLGEGAAIVGVGAVFGLIGAFLLRQTLQSQLYEVGALDPRVIGAVAGLLFVVALTACLLPARRAARTDLVVALTE